MPGRRKPRRRADAAGRGSERAPYFTRGSGHNKFGGYTEIPDEYQEVMDRLLRKHKAAADSCRRRRSSSGRGARIGIITIGGCDPAVREALDILAEQRHPRRLHAHSRRSRFDDSVEDSSTSTNSVSSSSRIAMRSFVRC